MLLNMMHSLSAGLSGPVIQVSMEANLTAIVLLRIMINKRKYFDHQPLINITNVNSLVIIHSSTDSFTVFTAYT